MCVKQSRRLDLVVVRFCWLELKTQFVLNSILRNIIVFVNLFGSTFTCMSDIVRLICHNGQADLKQMALQQRSQLPLSSVSLYGHTDAASLYLTPGVIPKLNRAVVAAVANAGRPWSIQTTGELLQVNWIAQWKYFKMLKRASGESLMLLTEGLAQLQAHEPYLLHLPLSRPSSFISL